MFGQVRRSDRRNFFLNAIPPDRSDTGLVVRFNHSIERFCGPLDSSPTFPVSARMGEEFNFLVGRVPKEKNKEFL